MPTQSEGARRTEDELRAALPMLERHAPSAEAVLQAVRDRGRRAPGLVRRGARPRRWPGWVPPVAAASAVVVVIIASLAISGVILRRTAGTGSAASSGAFARVPSYFVAASNGRAVVGATATGAVLGSVAPPKPYTMFRWVAAAGDSHTFLLGAAHTWPYLTGEPVKFYRLVLDRSGHPGRLSPLPIPPEPFISSMAVSPDGSKLAVSLAPARGQTGSKIQVFSLATGARRDWVWPGHGTVGDITPGEGLTVPGVTSSGRSEMSWEADNRTLLFKETTHTTAQLRLLDTAAPAGSLLASSTRIPIPSTDLDRWFDGAPLITGDGARLVAPFVHPAAQPRPSVFTITEFSVRTGKPVQVLYRLRAAGDYAATGVSWVNNSGTAVIASHGPVFGVQTPTTFTPLPPRTQRLFLRPGGIYYRIPAW